MKKLFAVLMAIALVFSMGTIAFAEGTDTGSITITNAVDGAKYEIYKMLDFTPSGEKTGIYTIVDGWADFFAAAPATNYFTVTKNAGQTTVALKDGVTEVDQTIAKAAVAYAENKSIAATATATADDETVEFTGLALGYYAIDTSLGTLCALTNTNSTFTAVEKNTEPDLEKKIVEDGNLVDANNAKIGDTITYQATITVGAGAENYVMHDKMSAGLTYVGVTSVKVNGADVDAKNYTVSTDADDCTFDIEFKNEYTSTLAKDTEIVVTYTATLDSDAVIGTVGNPNEAWLEYGDEFESTRDIVITYTTSFTVEKVDGDGDPLAGAGFTLYVKNAGGEWVAVGAEQKIESLSEGEHARYIWDGLAEGEYKLVETTVPAGYNKAADLEFKITCEEPETVNATSDTATWSSDKEVVKVTSGKFDTEVENKTGSLLPETGGIGTTIFYVVGGLLMVAAFVVLVSKKRMKSVA